jgi:hypothetical protein
MYWDSGSRVGADIGADMVLVDSGEVVRRYGLGRED